MRKAQILKGALLLIFFLIVMRPVRDWVRGYSEVTSYPMAVEEDGTNKYPLNRTIYRIYPKQNRVISWMPWIDEIPDELVDCAIRDRCNWKCFYSDHSSEVVMVGCLDKTVQVLYEWKSVSALEWWRYHYGL